MIRGVITIGIVIILMTSTGRAARERLNLERRITAAELIVVGELGTLKSQFSIVFKSQMGGIGTDQRNYKVGLISIEEVLMGELSPVELRDSLVGIALHESYEKDGKHVIMFPTPSTAYTGDKGVWLLKRGHFVNYYGLATFDCFLPLDSLDAVKKVLGNHRSD